jgi:hypothetical protein
MHLSNVAVAVGALLSSSSFDASGISAAAAAVDGWHWHSCWVGQGDGVMMDGHFWHWHGCCVGQGSLGGHLNGIGHFRGCWHSRIGHVVVVVVIAVDWPNSYVEKMFNYLKVNFLTIGRQISIELLAIGTSEQRGGWVNPHGRKQVEMLLGGVGIYELSRVMRIQFKNKELIVGKERKRIKKNIGKIYKVIVHNPIQKGKAHR